MTSAYTWLLQERRYFSDLGAARKAPPRCSFPRHDWPHRFRPEARSRAQRALRRKSLHAMGFAEFEGEPRATTCGFGRTIRRVAGDRPGMSSTYQSQPLCPDQLTRTRQCWQSSPSRSRVSLMKSQSLREQSEVAVQRFAAEAFHASVNRSNAVPKPYPPLWCRHPLWFDHRARKKKICAVEFDLPASTCSRARVAVSVSPPLRLQLITVSVSQLPAGPASVTSHMLIAPWHTILVGRLSQSGQVAIAHAVFHAQSKSVSRSCNLTDDISAETRCALSGPCLLALLQPSPGMNRRKPKANCARAHLSKHRRYRTHWPLLVRRFVATASRWHRTP